MTQTKFQFKGKRKGGSETLTGDLNHIDGKVYIFERNGDSTNSPDWYEVEPSSIEQLFAPSVDVEQRAKEYAKKQVLEQIRDGKFIDDMQPPLEAAYLAGTRHVANEKQGWISVDDKFPKVGQRVLVFCLSQGVQMCHLGYHNGGTYWMWSTDMTQAYLNVTHWMPLPSLPIK